MRVYPVPSTWAGTASRTRTPAPRPDRPPRLLAGSLSADHRPTAPSGLLLVESDVSQSLFDQLKATPSSPGVKNLQHELTKLQTLRARDVPPAACAGVPEKGLQLLKRRAANERAGEMRAHPPAIRYALLACFVHGHTMAVIDDAVRMTLAVIRRIDTQTEKHLEKTLLHDSKRVAGTVRRLYRIAEAVAEEPDGTIRTVLCPQVKAAIWRDLAAEAKAHGPQDRLWYQ
jgi:hypothetical protein